MSGWFSQTDVGSLVEKALAEAGRSTGSPWAQPRPLPLEAVDWATTADMAAVVDSEQWPPPTVAPRTERLALLYDLWRGDLSSVLDVRQLRETGTAATNIFRRTAKFVADLLVREAPEFSGDGLEDIDALMLVHDLLTDMVRYGGSLTLSAVGPEGPIIRRLDAQFAIPLTEGGWVVAEPRMTAGASSTLPNVLQFVVVHDGGAYVVMRSQTPTGAQAGINLGPVLDSGLIGTDAEVAVVPNLPSQPGGTWGTSWYEDLLTVAVQTTRRMAGNARVLDANSMPLLLLRGNMDRYTALPGVPLSRAVSTPRTSPEELQQRTEVAKRLVQAGPLILPDGVEDAEYVTWDGGLDASEKYLDRVDRLFRFMSGIPAVLDADTAVSSGMSLRRMFWQFDATVAPMHHAITRVLTAAAERLGGGFEWENVFEVVAESPMMTQREDVEDEENARRGEGEPDPEDV